MTDLLRAVLPVVLLAVATPACGSVTVSEVPPGPLSGTVLHLPGVPAEGVQVSVGDNVTVTDANGQFKVAFAGGTYDVALYPPGGSTVYAYLGLSDHAPTPSATARGPTKPAST